MKSTSPSPVPALVITFISLAVAICSILFLLRLTKKRAAEEREAFFNRSVTPILNANSTANKNAIENLKANIHAQFEDYRRRVPKFTKDITGIGNKTTITWEALKQMASDDKKKVERHVTGKFEMDVVSARQMQKDLELLLQGFRHDLDANRNRMLADIDAAVKNDPQLSAHGIKLPETFGKEIEKKIAETSLAVGKDTATQNGLTILTSMAAEEATRKLVTYVLAETAESLATAMGITAGTTGGSTAAGGAGGGTVGSSAGPVGTVVGIAVGLTVGLIVDYVMTERMDAKLNDECCNFLTKAEKSITQDPKGLIMILEKALAGMEKAKGPVIKQQIESLP